MTSRGRLLFILPDLSAGGAERTTLRVAGDLSARGFTPTLFLLRRRGELLGDVPAGVSLAWALDDDRSLMWNFSALASSLIKQARQSADVVIGALEHEATYLAYLCGRTLRRPVAGWVHAVMSEHLKEVSPAHTKLAGFIYPRLDRIVFPSQAAASSLATVAELRPDRTAVISSYIDTNRVRAEATKTRPEWAARVFANKPVVIGIGRLVPSKGFDILIRAHAHVLKSGIDHNLLILGEGTLRDVLRKLAGSLGVGDSVFLPGFVSNPYPMLKSSVLFALPSRFEALSLAILEALCLGVPVIATDCLGGPVSVLDRGRYGTVVPADDAAALATAISALLSDSRARDAFKEAGPARASEFSTESVVPLWERLLYDMCGRGL
jgi:glycosyltransferase involved in cell wall biosynthesis